MYVSITHQYRKDPKVTVWEGDWGPSGGNYTGGPAEAVRSFYQFSEGYEPVGWIADNISEEQFDALYAAGQRLFWLERQGKIMLVQLAEDPHYETYRKEREALEAKAKLYEELYESLLAAVLDFRAGELMQAEYDAILVVIRACEAGEITRHEMHQRTLAIWEAARARKGLITAPEG